MLGDYTSVTDIIIRIHPRFRFIVKTDEVSHIVDCMLSVSFWKTWISRHTSYENTTFKIPETFGRNTNFHFFTFFFHGQISGHEKVLPVGLWEWTFLIVLHWNLRKHN